MLLSVDYVYLSGCRGMCNDEYKNKVKNIMNKKISIDDVKGSSFLWHMLLWYLW